jgi:pentafunctional AROM polypeptide
MQVLNEVLTPVTHPHLPIAAAPGQISVKEINSTLAFLGFLDAKDFYLFGSPITSSPSPTMHNTGTLLLLILYIYVFIFRANCVIQFRIQVF